ncbi:MAG: DUF3093 domain-containing protein [Actinomycetota bacterium]|nr:DUF3093 domain-containing protein [Actinomycetota bacterium]
MHPYRERLWPAPWLFIATALVIPASLLVFLPINTTVGLVVAIVLYAGCVGLLLLGSPTIAVTDTTLVAGRARLPLDVVAGAVASRGAQARAERGTGLDARAYLVIRGWIDPVVRLTLDDPNDPTPYWLVSTRRPEELVQAISSAAGRAAREPDPQ